MSDAEIVQPPLTATPVAPYTRTSNELAKPALLDGPAAGMVDLLETLIEEAKKKLENPRQVKRLSIPELLEQINAIFKSLKSSNITINNTTIKNLEAIRQYGNDFDSADRTLRKEARTQLRTTLKRRPS